MKNQKGFIQVILVLIIVIVAIGGAYYFGTLKTKSDISSFVPTPTSIASSKPVMETEDPTVSWKTYTDNISKFSFKYPPKYEITTTARDSGDGFSYILSPDNLVTIKVFNKYTDNQSKYYMDSPNVGEISLGGNIWKTYYLPQGYPDGAVGAGNPIYGVQSEIQNHLFSVTLFNQTEILLEQKQILSTFKFVDSKEDNSAELTKYLVDQYYSQGKQYGKVQSEVVIKINKIESNFATGTGNFTSGGGDVWFATKIKGQWKIIEQTQEPPSCLLMAQYNFPKTIYGECIEK